MRDCFLAVDAELERAVRAAGFSEINPGHGVVLRHLGPEGARPSAMAAQARVTRQALSKAVDDLERLGLVRRDVDPSDGRAVIVRYTPRGLAGLQVARKRMEELELQIEEAVGVESWRIARHVLEEIAALLPRPN